MKAWWFSKGRVLPHDDGRQIMLGQTHKISGPIIPCENGLHASVSPLDALNYAPGPVIWRVELGGTIIKNSDKCVASERTYVAGGIDVSNVLRKFARLCALDVIHLWDAPEIVVQYLKTGDEGVRDAAWDVAWATGRAAAGAAAWATWRRATARAPARATAKDAARAAARAAAGVAAWDAAWDAAWATAWDAAKDAAKDAAGAAAWDAAWDAARKKQNARLNSLLNTAIRKEKDND